jgi:hypothetical protein
MKTKKAIQVLRDYNLWRRGNEDMDQPDPWEIGKAIDDAIEAMEELSEWKTLSGWGGTPEIIDDFIKGQQSRIYAAQEAEEQRDRLAEALEANHKGTLMLERMVYQSREQWDRLAEALERILSYQGRFAEEDPESIAAEALQSLTPNEL